MFLLSECILVIYLILKTYILSYFLLRHLLIRSCIFYIHYFFNRYTQFHFFHFLRLALYEIISCYIHSLLSSLFVAYIVLTRFFRLFPHLNFLLLYDILFLCIVLFRSSFSVYLVILSRLCLLLYCATCICISCLYIVSCAPQVDLALDLAATGRSSRVAGNSGACSLSFPPHCASLLRLPVELARGRSRRRRAVGSCCVCRKHSCVSASLHAARVTPTSR